MKRLAGIYLIKWQDSSSFYIGSSVNIPRRINDHFSLLRRGRHYNVALTAAYNKYGDTMTYYVVQQVSNCTVGRKPYILHDLEQDWIDDLNPKYNRTREVRSPSRDPKVASRISEALRGRPLSLEARSNLSKALTGRKLTPSHREAISRGIKGREVSRETRLAIGSANRGRACTPSHRDKIRKSLTGYKHTEEARSNMSASQRGKKLSPEHVEKIRQRQVGSYKLSPIDIRRARSVFSKMKGSERSRLLAIADTFEVSFSTARNIIREIGPYRRAA